VGALVGGASYAYQADATRKAAHAQEDAAVREAKQAQERADAEEKIAQEKRDAEITMAQERLTFEEQTRKEKADFVTSQMAKSSAELKAAAIAGFAASGIDISESSSALSVFKKIDTESKIQQGEVKKDYQNFVAAREMEFKQLKTQEDLTYDWFSSRLHQETQWTVENKLSEAAAYRTKADYATIGGFLGAAGELAGGAADFGKTYYTFF
jgi:hypothetical protein